MRPISSRHGMATAADGTAVMDAHRVTLYAGILDRLPEAVAVLDAEGYFVEVNEAHAALVDEAAGDVSRHTPERYLGREIFLNMMEELAATGTFRRSVTWTTGTGGRRELDYAAYAMTSDRGRAVCFVTVATDVTGRVELEALLADMVPSAGATSGTPITMKASDGATSSPYWAEPATPSRANGEGRRGAFPMSTGMDPRHSLALLSAIMDTVTDIVFVKDLQGRYLHMNAMGCRLLGCALEDVIGKDDDAIWPSDLADCCKQADCAVLQTGTSQTFEDSTITAGQLTTYLTVKAPYRDDTGRIIGIVGIARDITERKVAEERLREREQRLTLAAEGSSDALWDGVCVPGKQWYDRDNPLWWSPRIRQILALDETETFNTLGQWAERLHPDDSRCVFAALTAHAEQRVPFDVEYRIRTNRGNYRWLRGRGQGAWDDQGHPTRMSGSCQDITEQKQAEVALRESEERYRQLVDLSPCGIFVFCDERTVYVNQAACRILGAESPEQILEHPTLYFIHPEWHATVRENVAKLLAGQASIRRAERRYMKLDRTVVHVEVEASLIFWNGTPAIQGIFTDITERKQAEASLRASEELFAKAFRSSPYPIVISELDTGLCLDANDAALSQFGYGREEVVGRTSMDIGLWASSEARDRFVGHLKERRAVRNVEVSFRNKSGEWRRCLVSAELVDLHGKSCMVAVGHDITDQKRAEEALRTSEELFAKTFRASPNPIGITELASGRCIDVNEACLKLFGYTREEVVGQTTLMLGIWPKPEDRAKLVEQVIAAGPVRNYEMKFRMKDGQLRHILVSSDLVEMNGRSCLVTVGNDITERKQAEEDLRESEHRYRTLVESIKDVVYLISPDGVILSLNSAFELRTGWSQAEWIGKPFLELVHPGDHEVAIKGLKRALAGVKDTRTELRIQVKGGGWIVAEGAGGPYLEKGVVVGILGVARDITERRQAEEALRQSQVNLRRITDAIPGFVYQYRVGPDGSQSFPFASRGTKELLGCEAAELEADAGIGWKMVLPEDIPSLQASIQTSALHLSPWTHEFRVRGEQGAIKWVRGSSLPERQPDGGTVWYGLFTDVTARRDAERQLRFTQFAMDHAADAILWAGPDRRLVYANHEACRSLGYTRGELLQLDITTIAPQHDAALYSERLKKLKQGQTEQYESVHRRKDSSEFPVELAIRYLEDDGVGYTCGIARDITERKLLEQRLRHADRLATLGTITAGVAHELNNPLFVITGHLHLIERKLARRQLKALRKELIAAQEAAGRATAIVGQFLSTAHVSTGVRERCDLADIARQALTLMRSDLRARHIRVESEFRPGLPPVMADPQSLVQVLLNLLTNARQAIEGVGTEGWIRLTLQTVPIQGIPMVECRVADSGPGVSPEHLPRIFDPFFTTKPVGDGTGLGLAICHRIVSELYGTITCESPVGRGAEFIFRLPALRTESPFLNEPIGALQELR